MEVQVAVDRPTRVQGVRKPMVGFRAPQDVQQYLDAVEDKTDVMVQGVRLIRDLREELGPDWWEVERRAKVEGVSVGAVLGQLAFAQLKSEKKLPKR